MSKIENSNIKIVNVQDLEDISDNIKYFLDSIVLLDGSRQYSLAIIGNEDIMNYIFSDVIFKDYNTSIGWLEFYAEEKTDFLLTVNERLIVNLIPIGFEYNVQELDDSEDIFVVSDDVDERIINYCATSDSNVYTIKY